VHGSRSDEQPALLATVAALAWVAEQYAVRANALAAVGRMPFDSNDQVILPT
jgi:hypothetical protein